MLTQDFNALFNALTKAKAESAKQLHNFALFIIKSPYINIPIIIVSLTGSSAIFDVLPHISPYYI